MAALSTVIQGDVPAGGAPQPLRPEDDATAIGISTGIVWMTHLIERYVNTHIATFDLPPGMTLNRIWALVQLFRQQQQGCVTRMSDFAGTLGITARSVTTVVDVLETQGLLERRDDPGDRRVTLLHLTARAEQLMPELERVMCEAGNHLCAPLPESDRRDLLRLLGKLCR